MSRYASTVVDDSPPTGDADNDADDSGDHPIAASDRPGLADRPAGSRLRRWELVILAVALVIVVVAAIAT